MKCFAVISMLAVVGQIACDPSKLQGLYGSSGLLQGSGIRSGHVGGQHPIGHDNFYDAEHVLQDNIHAEELHPIDFPAHHGDLSVGDVHQDDFNDENVHHGNVHHDNFNHDHVHSKDHSTVGTAFTLPKHSEFNVVGDVTTVVADSGITITEVVTKDVFSTFTNLIYNTIPVTLTDFVKSTATAYVTNAVSTGQNDRVFVSTVPVLFTGTIAVTDTSSKFQIATEVSTEFYTVTHSSYDINQQVVVSTVIQTRVVKPTIVSTRIATEYETHTDYRTETNTVLVGRRQDPQLPPFREDLAGANHGNHGYHHY